MPRGATKLINLFAHAALFILLRFLGGLFLFCRQARLLLGLFVALLFSTHDIPLFDGHNSTGEDVVVENESSNMAHATSVGV